MDQPSGWWMYHGDWAHSGAAPAGSSINAAMLKANGFGILHTLSLGGPVLSVPAVCNGSVYVGLANSLDQVGLFGGMLRKIDLASGEITATYTWQIQADERDSHGFCGMGCTPSVIGGFVYFVGFNAKLYCLNEGDLSLVWVTDLRNRDPGKNQPVQSFDPTDPYPPAAGWCAPLVVGDRIFIGIGEGENPHLFSFVYCLDTASGTVVWIMCTNIFHYMSQNIALPNIPNVLPASVVPDPPPAPFTALPDPPLKGSSVWGCIAYDETLDRLYCPTGNGAPDGPLPTEGWTNGLLALDAGTGAFKGFFQPPAASNYRVTDNDVDMGGSPTLFNLANGQRVVGVASKNGSYFILDADTLELIAQRQMLPYYNDGTQIPTVDPHEPALDGSQQINPHIPNSTSDQAPDNDEENFSGSYSTAAFDPATGRLFCGLGGNNYHTISPGIDTDTTPFMRAMNLDLSDAWPVDSNNPPRYSQAMPPMYSNYNESGLSSPAVVNDLVFMGTTNVSVYAFSTADGTMLWQDQLGEQTGGMNGGYGYCMGPAICGDYVVAGGLVFGGDGGILRIYGPGGTPPG